MYISINWLNYVLNLRKTNLVNLQERLTLTGFEVEETKVVCALNKDDIVIDLAATTNRPDILSIAGIANEISSLTGIEIKKSFLKKQDINFFENSQRTEPSLTKQLNFPATLAYVGSKVENVNFQSSPIWLKRRLISNGINPEGNLIDLSNYFLLEWGQPFFIYDFDKIKKLTKNENPKIQTRFAKLGETFIDCNSKNYLLTPETLLVVADNYPISIAGSAISQEVCIDSNSCNLFIEGSIFDPKVFRKSERSVGIRTEASIRYERGVNKFLLKPAYNRFLKLLTLFDKSSLLKITFCYKYFKENLKNIKVINLSYSNVNETLGFINDKKTTLSDEKICNFLRKLNFRVLEKEKTCDVLIPFTRFLDIEQEIDLIEEIARISGFNKFISILPKPNKIGKISKYESQKRKFREAFLNIGFIETFNYSLTQVEEQIDKPKLLNPLTSDYCTLRISLIPQLIKVFQTNISQGNQALPIFEIGRTFEKINENSISEGESIAAIWGGSKYRTSWSNESLEFNWFQAKGVLDTVFSNLNLNIKWNSLNTVKNFYHPKSTLEILCENEKVGVFGKIHPRVADQNGLSKNCFLFELDLTKLIKVKASPKSVVYQKYSLYPNISVDLSLLVPKHIKFQGIKQTIAKKGKSLLDKIELFDLYEQIELSQGYYSIAVKLSFRAFNKTLVKTEVDPILSEIEKELEKELDIKIRT